MYYRKRDTHAFVSAPWSHFVVLYRYGYLLPDLCTCGTWTIHFVPSPIFGSYNRHHRKDLAKLLTFPECFNHVVKYNSLLLLLFQSKSKANDIYRLFSCIMYRLTDYSVNS